MYSIGTLSKRTGVKVPTIRYYEQVGLLAQAERTQGNQRRYDKAGLDRLAFIKHGRDLGFSITALVALIDLQDHPDRGCDEATGIARGQLTGVREKIARLKRLEQELARIATSCDGAGVSENCAILMSLGDHTHCETEH